MNNDGKKFVVKPDFDNTGKTGDHYNNNAIPGIHASTYEIAQKYAAKRTRDYYNQKATSLALILPCENVCEIVGTEPDLKLIDVCKFLQLDELEPFLTKVYKMSSQDIQVLRENILTDEQDKQMRYAWSTLIGTYKIPELMPHLFEDKGIAIKIYKDLVQICKDNKKLGQGAVITDADCENYAKKRGHDNISSQLIQDMTGCINVYQLLKQNGDIGLLVSKLQSNFNFTENSTLNLDLFKSFLSKMSIVGVHQKIWASEVIDDGNFDDYFIFDTSRITTLDLAKKQKRQEQKEQEIIVPNV